MYFLIYGRPRLELNRGTNSEHYWFLPFVFLSEREKKAMGRPYHWVTRFTCEIIMPGERSSEMSQLYKYLQNTIEIAMLP